MRHTVSKRIPNHRAGPLLPPSLSFWSDDTPSDSYSFPVDILPVCLRFFQLISPSPLSHISSVSVPHIFCRHIHTCFPVYPPQCSSTDVFTAYFTCHPHYPDSPPHLHCRPPASMLRLSSHYLPSSRVLCRRCFYTFSDQIFSSLCVVLYYTAFSDLLHTNFITLRSDLLTTVFFSVLARLFSLCVMLLLCSNLPLFLHLPSLRFALILSFLSDMSTLICLHHLWSTQLWLLRSCSNLIAPICLLWSSWIRSLISAVYFVPLDLQISLKITHHYGTHHLILACTIT